MNAKCPFLKPEDNAYMLKVKKKYDKTSLNETNDSIFLNLVFKYYCMETDDDKLLQGYYVGKLELNEEKENKN